MSRETCPKELAEQFDELMAGRGFTNQQLEDHIDIHEFILNYITARNINENLFTSMKTELLKMKMFQLMRQKAAQDKPDEPEAA